MKIDYTIDRIANGYIATGNDSSQSRRFYKNIEAFIASNLNADIYALSQEDQQHDNQGLKRRIVISIDVMNDNNATFQGCGNIKQDGAVCD